MTRIWMINPELLCRQHLLGQWKELFQLVGSIKKGISIQGYLDNGLVTTSNLNEYALDVRNEMLKRGYNAKEWVHFDCEKQGEVDIQFNIQDLSNRCEKCKANIMEVSL